MYVPDSCVDTTKLKKHIQVVVDRIAKGMPLYKYVMSPDRGCVQSIV